MSCSRPSHPHGTYLHKSLTTSTGYGTLGAMSTNHRGIVVEGLVRTFKGDIHAVDGIDLEVAAGEIYGFLGPNGAGKSTTVHMLTTLLPPTAGRATVAGFDVATQGADVRRNIGAALQEAALDNFLTGREHMDLQAGLNGLAKADRAAPRDRAARARRPHRGGRPQGRRLLGRHEAPPGPRPGARAPPVDPLPRRADDGPGPPEPQRAVGRGRSAWPREDGVTVFLTTQYLEEADVLADRVGIIDRGQDRGRGHARRAQARHRRRHGRGDPRRPARPRARGGGAGALRRARGALAQGRRGAPRAAAPSSWPTSCARSTTRASRSRTCSCTRRRSTTSSWPRPGARWRAPARRARRRRRGGRAGVTAVAGHQVGLVARRSVRRTLRQPALIVPTLVFPLFLLAVNSSGLSAATNIPGFPADSYLDFAITVTLHPGRDVRRDHRGHRARDRHRDRLPQPPAAHAAAAAGDPRRADGGRDDAGADRRRDLPRRRRDRRASTSRAASAARSCSSSTPCSSPSPSRGSARRSARGPARPRRCRAPSRSCSRCSSCRR